MPSESAPATVRTDPGAADDAAIAWFVRLHDETASEADSRMFESWRGACPAHDAAWREVERIWGGLDRLAEVHASPVRADRRRATPRLPRTHWVWPRLAAAAALLFAVAVAWQSLPAGAFADYRAEIGERRIVRLGDGSEVELGSGAALDVDFSASERRVRLFAGEAFFTVASEPGRPFAVVAEQGRVEVLGTAFNVRIADGVTVVVTHNVVQVGMGATPPVRVAEGNGVHYGRAGLSAVAPADLDVVQAWRQDQIVFHDAPLDLVLAELRRYRRGHVQVIGGDLGSRRVTAVFDTRRTDAALETIARSLDLRVFKATDLFVALMPR